jgi:UDP-N-acetylmuramate--alanine ligase
VLIHNSDDPGCRVIVDRLRGAGIDLIPYGRAAPGDYRLSEIQSLPGVVRFRLAGCDGAFELRVPGVHNVHNAAAAIALVCSISGAPLSRQPAQAREWLRVALQEFHGSKRRAEIVGSSRGVLVLDDYGHHPTEISTTLAGLKSFYAGRRLIVDFMPHLYSRTLALFDSFVPVFDAADEVILHRIYASARERDDGTVTGRRLAEEVARRREAVRYFEEPLDAVGYLVGSLREGDVLVTMGAGDNWRVGRAVLDRLAGAAEGAGS